jgi:hypothetical protein
MSSVQLLIQKEDKIISEFQDKILSMKQKFIEPKEIEHTEAEHNINVYVPKRRNKKTIETVAPTENDLKKLAEKEQLRKEKAKLYAQQNREKKLEYLREYAKTHRNNQKEKQYYQENKDKIFLKSKLNQKKYMTFYTKYIKEHPEFQKDWDEQCKPELIKKYNKKDAEKTEEKDLEE